MASKPIRLTREEILHAGEIWCQLQEAMVYWGGPRWERDPDGSVNYDRIKFNVTVNDLAWAIKNNFRPLADAFMGAAGPDPRIADVKAKLLAIVNGLSV